MVDNILHRKVRLILTTIEIIDDLGIQKLSTREIATRQGISEATLFRHFKSKNDLLVAVLDYFSQFDFDIYESIRIKGLKPKESLLYLFTSYAEYYENYPAITAIMQVYDVLRCEPELAFKIQDIFNNRNQYIKQFIEEAQKDGEISVDADSEDITDLISGFWREICLKWRLNGREFSLKDKIIKNMEMLLNALSKV